ncbi:uncharacterized protein JCM10292_002403 [Rhodotorula paludigena]|uniref:uncharacterized protein n=1 Tax=Rhodotorula paludigena TaxID=86838 RepID=UPI00317DD726
MRASWLALLLAALHALVFSVAARPAGEDNIVHPAPHAALPDSRLYAVHPAGAGDASTDEPDRRPLPFRILRGPRMKRQPRPVPDPAPPVGSLSDEDEEALDAVAQPDDSQAFRGVLVPLPLGKRAATDGIDQLAELATAPSTEGPRARVSQRVAASLASAAATATAAGDDSVAPAQTMPDTTRTVATSDVVSTGLLTRADAPSSASDEGGGRTATVFETASQGVTIISMASGGVPTSSSQMAEGTAAAASERTSALNSAPDSNLPGHLLLSAAALAVLLL